MGDATGGRLVLSRRKQLAFSVLVPIVTIAVVLLVIEVVLRFLPVSTGLRSLPVTPDSPIFRFTPDRPFVTSFGWDMHNVVHGRVNNAGFVNDQDYRRDDPVPLLAVIGDSYIEAQMVPYADTMHGRLAHMLAGKARVYSFAASGAPLSQFLIWAGYAVREYGAKSVVINVVGNDFDESLLAYKVGPGFWLYAPDLDPHFTARHAQTGERFVFPNDGHWNANGHAVAAQAVLSSQPLIRSLQ